MDWEAPPYPDTVVSRCVFDVDLRRSTMLIQREVQLRVCMIVPSLDLLRPVVFVETRLERIGRTALDFDQRVATHELRVSHVIMRL